MMEIKLVRGEADVCLEFCTHKWGQEERIKVKELAGDQREEEPKKCKGRSTTTCFSLCGDLAGHKSSTQRLQRLHTGWELHFPNAEHLEAS